MQRQQQSTAVGRGNTAFQHHKRGITYHHCANDDTTMCNTPCKCWHTLLMSLHASALPRPHVHEHTHPHKATHLLLGQPCTCQCQALERVQAGSQVRHGQAQQLQRGKQPSLVLRQQLQPAQHSTNTALPVGATGTQLQPMTATLNRLQTAFAAAILRCCPAQHSAASRSQRYTVRHSLCAAKHPLNYFLF